MNKDTVIIKTYIRDENSTNIEDKEYIFNLNDKIMDIKNKILADTFNNKYNSLDMTNITDRVYKDFGKLFFDKGLLPLTIDNYKLSEFTIGDRTFLFLVSGKNTVKINDVKKDCKFIQKIIKEDRKKDEGFVFFDDDFPPLSSSKK
jgi:hypothetical protein